MTFAETTVLDIARNLSLMARDLRRLCEARGVSDRDARDAIANLWDSGYINVGLDQRIKVNE
jgi:hypothetical protein